MGDVPKEILYPFAIGPDGGIAATEDPDKQVHQHVWALLGTEPGERVMLTDYGVRTRNLLFEAGDTHVADQLADNTRQQMDVYEPGVLVQSIEAVPSDRYYGVANVALEYVRRDAPSTPFGIARQSNTAYIGVGGTVSEVIRG